MRLYEPPYRLVALGIGLPTILYLWGLPLSPSSRYMRPMCMTPRFRGASVRRN